MIENIALLEHLLQKDPSINEVIKCFILLDDSVDSGGMCLDFVENREKIITWNEMLERGKLINDSILKEREKQQEENQACALMYTRGTTGNLKGITGIYWQCITQHPKGQMYYYYLLINILNLLGEIISHDDITSRNSRFYHWTSHYLIAN